MCSTHLVLKILSGHQRIPQQLSRGTQHSFYFPTSTRALGIHVKSFPQVVDAISAWPRPSINQDTDVRVQHRSKGLEEPSVRVDLLLILFLEAEEYLNWRLSIRSDFDQIILVQLDSDLCRVLMSR
jgi:hypothetical protein